MAKLTKGLRLVLITILEDKFTALTWGITNIKISEYELNFDVMGLCYIGPVSISVPDDVKCIIKLGSRVISCNISDVVDVLDSEIERKGNYSEHLIKILNL